MPDASGAAPTDAATALDAAGDDAAISSVDASGG
jgi:hypothetical protein